jgi:hypothetical protein
MLQSKRRQKHSLLNGNHNENIVSLIYTNCFLNRQSLAIKPQLAVKVEAVTATFQLLPSDSLFSTPHLQPGPHLQLLPHLQDASKQITRHHQT